MLFKIIILNDLKKIRTHIIGTQIYRYIILILSDQIRPVCQQYNYYGTKVTLTTDKTIQIIGYHVSVCQFKLHPVSAFYLMLPTETSENECAPSLYGSSPQLRSEI